jgi:phage shock protein B
MIEPMWFLLIPVVAILARVARDWIRLRASQRELGASSRETERAVADLKRQRDELQQRVENLEAIVASQTWNAIQDRSLPEPVREQRIAATVQHELRSDQEAVNRQRIEQLAQRLR